MWHMLCLRAHPRGISSTLSPSVVYLRDTDLERTFSAWVVRRMCILSQIFRVHFFDFECRVFTAAHFAVCCQLCFSALLVQTRANIHTICVDCNRAVSHFAVCSVLYAHRYLRCFRYCADLQSMRMKVIDAFHRPRMSNMHALGTSYILFRNNWNAFLETETVHCIIIKTLWFLTSWSGFSDQLTNMWSKSGRIQFQRSQLRIKQRCPQDWKSKWKNNFIEHPEVSDVAEIWIVLKV